MNGTKGPVPKSLFVRSELAFFCDKPDHVWKASMEAHGQTVVDLFPPLVFMRLLEC